MRFEKLAREVFKQLMLVKNAEIFIQKA